MVEIKIKTMTPEDVVQVHKVEEACFSVPWSLENFERIFRYKENYYLTAWDGDAIVGFIGLMAVAGEGDITNVAVLPSHRKQGIGDRLVKSMIDLAKEKEISKIMLEVRSSNEAAIHLYEKYGFEFLCIRKNYYQKPTEDANIMCWQM
jgi:ribosomal-protein-alanine N-acetyltransferase